MDLGGELQGPLRRRPRIFGPVLLETEIGEVEERRRLAQDVAGVFPQREALLVISGRVVESAQALIDEPDVVESLRFPEAAARRAVEVQAVELELERPLVVLQCVQRIADAIERAGFARAVPEASKQLSSFEKVLLRLPVILPVIVEGAQGLQSPRLTSLVRDRLEEA